MSSLAASTGNGLFSKYNLVQMLGRMILSDFESLWHFITHRGCIIVQERTELEHIFNLIQGCKSLLEVGTAEGNSMHALGHALKKRSFITSIDYGERHTEPFRTEVLKILRDQGIYVNTIDGTSQYHDVIRQAKVIAPYDVVLIDAGHDYTSVVADAIAYGGMATKFILFHDVQLPEVRKAFDWYVNAQGYKNVSTFINSTEYGYGIITL